MEKLNSIAWYAARLTPELPKEAFKPQPARLLGGLAYLIVIAASILAIGLFDLNIWVSLALSLVIGASFAGMGFLGHEILHGVVVRKPWVRDLLGAIAFWPLCTGPSLWRKWHNVTHHVHTQHEHEDPDAWATYDELAQKPLLRWAYRMPLWFRSLVSYSFLTLQFTMHSSRMFMVYVKEFNPKNQPKVWMQLILPWASWIGLLVWIGFANWFFAFLLPLLIANFIVMAYISTNHRLNPITEINDPLANSLTVTVPKWVDVLHFNFSYHAEHHLFPGMSPKYYPLVKEKIKQKWPERYHEMPLSKALLALWKTPRVYYSNEEFIDPRQSKLYNSLGNGFDLGDIKGRKLAVEEEASPVSAKQMNR